MPTEIDHTAIEQAIEALIEADSTVYDENSIDGTKLKSVEEGIPLISGMQPELLPGAFITLESEVFRNRGTIGSNTVRSFEHDIRYRIRVAIGDFGNKKNESVLNSIQKKILEIIESNNKLTDNVDECFPESIQRVKETEKDAVFARDIIIKCTKTSN